MIYIASYRGHSLTSRLIKLGTWSDIGHSVVFLPDLETVIEAWGGGVVRRHWAEGHAPGTEITIYRVQCGPEQAERFYQFVTAQVGKRYDFFGVFNFAFHVNRNNSDTWFCSELVFAGLQTAGITALARVPAWKVSPGLLDKSPLLEEVTHRRV